MMADTEAQETATIFANCRRLVSTSAWQDMQDALDREPDFSTLAQKVSADTSLPQYIPDLARLEWALQQAAISTLAIPAQSEKLSINPTLQLLEVQWRNLTAILNDDGGMPKTGNELLLVSQNPLTKSVDVQSGGQEELLILKMISEDITPEGIAAAGNLPIGAVDQAIYRAIDNGLLIAPESTIKRDISLFPADFPAPVENFSRVDVFTLQWHITQHCDLHCKHCYDRSKRDPLSLPQAIKILDEFRAFCHKRHVRGQISFSGGNPLLYPDFTQLYREAANRGFGLAILGNPAPKEQIQELIDIQMPSFYQVSLEGLQEHNDNIRGLGHFDRILAFLKILQELEVYSMVMLTLTRANTPQVLPLAERLRGATDSFTFNRLAMVGEGAALQSADPEEFKQLLTDYQEAAKTNPTISIKDNFLNITRWQQGMDLFGGCAGYGCSAAFSFISILPDGEVHACRKFPSLVGNILDQPLAEIFDSEAAQRYRAGTSACGKCTIRPVCGGCLAVSHGFGLDIYNERDPYCFLEVAD